MKYNYKNPLEVSDDRALAQCIQTPPIKTTTSYNEPGLPKPPAGWGKVVGFKDSVDGDDEGPESKDEY